MNLKLNTYYMTRSGSIVYLDGSFRDNNNIILFTGDIIDVDTYKSSRGLWLEINTPFIHREGRDDYIQNEINIIGHLLSKIIVMQNEYDRKYNVLDSQIRVLEHRLSRTIDSLDRIEIKLRPEPKRKISSWTKIRYWIIELLKE